MINKCIEITKLIGDFRLNADLRRLQLFMHLLNQANEQGELSFNASEYAKAYGIDRTAMSRLLGYMEENGYIAKKTINGKTRITICAYNYYVVVADTASAVSAKETQREESAVEENEKNEKKSTPFTPLKEEKKKKEKTSTKNNKKKENEIVCATDADLCYSADNKLSMSVKRVRKLQEKPIDDRKTVFWENLIKYIEKCDRRGKNFSGKLKEWIDKENIPVYFNCEQLTKNFFSHWCQEVGMTDSDGEEAGVVLLFETQGGWDWWNRLTSFVSKGYELQKEADVRDTVRQDKLSVSKARRRTSESNSQKAHAQAVAAKAAAGIGGEATEIDEARLMVGFDYFWRQYKVKANMELAKAIWRTLSMNEKIDAINGASPYCTYCDMENIKIVYPDKYLQNRRWTDDIPDEYYEFYEEGEEEAENEAINSIKQVYDEIDAELDKKFEDGPRDKKLMERRGNDNDNDNENEDDNDNENDNGNGNGNGNGNYVY